MVLVENIREILKDDGNVTVEEIAQRLDIQVEVAFDILRELRKY
jgi:ribosomal protein S25